MRIAVNLLRNFKQFKASTVINNAKRAQHNNIYDFILTATSKPPMWLRISLVGTTVGVATPVFAVAGFVRLWQRYVPRGMSDVLGAFTLRAGSIVGGACATLIFYWVGPFLLNHSEFVLPFAVANGMTASFWYLLGELIFGLEFMIGNFSFALAEKTLFSKMLQNISTKFGGLPVGGICVGLLTAATCHLAWPSAFKLCWDEDFQDLVLNDDAQWLINAYKHLLLPVGLPIGALAGLSIQGVLQGFVVGRTHVPWTMSSLPMFLGVVGASGVYFIFCRHATDDFFWIQRLDPLTGNNISYNVRTREFLHDSGFMGDDSETKRRLFQSFHNVRTGVSNFFSSILRGTEGIHSSNGGKKVADMDNAKKDKGPSGQRGDGLPATVLTSNVGPGAANGRAASFGVTTQQKITEKALREVELLYKLMDLLVRLRHLRNLVSYDPNKRNATASATGPRPSKEEAKSRAQAAAVAINVLQKRAVSEFGLSALSLDNILGALERIIVAERQLMSVESKHPSSPPDAARGGAGAGARVLSPPNNVDGGLDKNPKVVRFEKMRDGARQVLAGELRQCRPGLIDLFSSTSEQQHADASMAIELLCGRLGELETDFREKIDYVLAPDEEAAGKIVDDFESSQFNKVVISCGAVAAVAMVLFVFLRDH